MWHIPKALLIINVNHVRKWMLNRGDINTKMYHWCQLFRFEFQFYYYTFYLCLPLTCKPLKYIYHKKPFSKGNSNFLLCNSQSKTIYIYICINGHRQYIPWYDSMNECTFTHSGMFQCQHIHSIFHYLLSISVNYEFSWIIQMAHTWRN